MEEPAGNAGRPSWLRRCARAVGRVLMAAAIALVVCLHWNVEPVRTFWVDSFLLDFHVLPHWVLYPDPSEGYATSSRSELLLYDNLFVSALTISLLLFHLFRPLLRRLRIQSPAANGALSWALAVAGTIGLLAAYPVAKEAYLYPRFLREADSLTVVYGEMHHYGGPTQRGRPRVLYSNSDKSKGWHPLEWRMFWRWREEINRSERRISGDEMRDLLAGLRARGFFRFGASLYPHDTSGGIWRYILIGNENIQANVVVFGGTEFDLDFQCCANLLKDAIR